MAYEWGGDTSGGASGWRAAHRLSSAFEIERLGDLYDERLDERFFFREMKSEGMRSTVILVSVCR